MTVTPLKIFLFTAGVSVATGATAYVSGAFDPYLDGNSAQLAVAPAEKSDRIGTSAGQISSPVLQGAADPSAPAPAGGSEEPAAQAPVETSSDKAAEPLGRQMAALPDASTEDAVPQPEPNAPGAPGKSAAAKPQVIPPSFDVLRVEANGSIVIAGNAEPGARVEVLTGSRVLADTASGAEGDFAVVLEKPLDPGEYEIVLRSTAPDNVVATSTETAVVSIPDDQAGQVLALVEQPGEPSRLITVPEPEQPAAGVPEANEPEAPAEPAGKTAEAESSATEGKAQSSEMAAADPKQPPASEAAEQEPAAQTILVEAVEIEGRKIFVAGRAEAGRLVRVYANEILLGETKASPEGRFLVEAERDLPVGDYIIRADALEPDGVKVVARAAVPFEREPGEKLAAVASPAGQPTAEPADEGQAGGAAETKPAPSAAEVPAGEKTGRVKQADASQTQPATQTEAPGQAATAVSSSEAVPSGPSVAAAKPNTSTTPSEGSSSVAPATGEATSPAVPETVAPKLQPVNSAVIIRRGDTLWQISRRVYGRGVRYATIYLANQDQIRNPDRIWPGQVFRVPDKTGEGETADMKAIGEQAVTAQ